MTRDSETTNHDNQEKVYVHQYIHHIYHLQHHIYSGIFQLQHHKSNLLILVHCSYMLKRLELRKNITLPMVYQCLQP